MGAWKDAVQLTFRVCFAPGAQGVGPSDSDDPLTSPEHPNPEEGAEKVRAAAPVPPCP